MVSLAFRGITMKREIRVLCDGLAQHHVGADAKKAIAVKQKGGDYSIAIPLIKHGKMRGVVFGIAYKEGGYGGSTIWFSSSKALMRLLSRFFAS